MLQFSSVTQSCPTLCDPMDCSMPGLSVYHSSWGLLKLMSIELVMPSNYSSPVIPFSSCLQSCPATGSFSMSQFFTSGSQSIGASASASVLPINIQDWFLSVLTGLICLLPKGLSRVRDGLRTLRQCWCGPSVDPCPSSLRLDDEGHYNLLLTHL